MRSNLLETQRPTEDVPPTILTREKTKTYLYERTGSNTLTAYGVTKKLYSGQTRFQKVDLWENPDHGKLLLLDGELQSASNDEFIYHETLIHPAQVRCQTPRSALILGGGEGGTLRELLRLPSLRRAVMVDIDGEVVEMCRHLMPEQSQGAFDDSRTEFIAGDAEVFLENCEERFDLIVSDLTEPMNGELSSSLFSVETFRKIRSLLAPGGVFSLQASNGSLGQTESHLKIKKNLSQAFPQVKTLLVHIPSFCCHWCFAIASVEADLRPSQELIAQRLSERGLTSLRFYDEETDLRLNSLPRYLRKELEDGHS